jgi:hypothetical protein
MNFINSFNALESGREWLGNQNIQHAITSLFTKIIKLASLSMGIENK